MKRKKIDYETFELDGQLRSLPNIPVSQATKDKILNNVLKSKKNKNLRLRNSMELLKPASFAVAMILMVLIITTSSNLMPQSATDGFYLSLDVNVKGAEIFLGSERLGETKITKKVNEPGEITIKKDGYTEWVGSFKGTDIENAIKTFDALGKYQIYRGSNTIRILVELDPIRKDKIYIDTEQPGAKILVNGVLVGSTPLNITLSSVDNIVEVIQTNKEKVSLEITFDGEIKIHGEVDQKENGYVLNIASENLYYPLDSVVVSESEILVLETNGVLYRGKIVNIDSNEVTIADNNYFSEYVKFNEEGFVFNQRLYLNDNGKSDKSFVTKKGLLTVDSGLLTILADGEKKVIENSLNPQLISIDGDSVFYQVNRTLYQYGIISEKRSTVATNLSSRVEQVQILKTGELVIQMDGNIYFGAREQLEKIEFFNEVYGFSILNDKILVFSFEDYINIWKYHMEKENIRKIY